MAKKTILKESWCPMCGTTMPKEDFYKSNSPAYEDTECQPFCKEHSGKLYEQYYNLTNQHETAIYYMCALTDTPYVDSALEMFLTKKNRYKNIEKLWGVYVNCVQMINGASTKYRSFIDSNISKEGTVVSKQVKQQEIEEIQELQFFWGANKTPEELEFLEETLSKYTKGVELETYQESLYKDLCLAECKIWKGEDVGNAIKQKQSIAKTLGLDNFKSNETTSLAEQTLEYQIWVMENEEPAEYMEKQDLYKDFLGLGKSWLLDILRPVRNIITGAKDYKISDEELVEFDNKVEEVINEESIDR